jgi:hypothetical protein
MEDVAARLDRLERLILEKNPTPGEERRSSRRHHHPHAPAPAVTIRTVSLHDRVRTRYFGQYSTKVLLNLVRSLCSGDRHAVAFPNIVTTVS